MKQTTPRPYKFSGVGYPENHTELEALLDKILGDPTHSSTEKTPRASVLPHIDLFRCQETYRTGYRKLQALARPEQPPLTVVILGISHAESRTPFVLTKSDFETPLGLVETDVDLVEQLAQDLPFDPYLEEQNHWNEHSIELHAVLLQRLFQNRRKFKIVPILCANFNRAITDRCCPVELPGVLAFQQNLAKLRDQQQNIHFLASVDLAHMGLEFGGKRFNLHGLQDLEKRDLESLSAIRGGKADQFFVTHVIDEGQRNYCGIPAIYLTLMLFPEPFQLLKYQQSTRRDLSSVVTVCSAILD